MPGVTIAEAMAQTAAVMVGTALDLDVSPLAMFEVFLQAGLYGGFVTTEAAVEVAREVFAARGVTVPGTPAREDSDETLDARGQEIMAKLHGERASGGYAAGRSRRDGSRGTHARCSRESA